MTQQYRIRYPRQAIVPCKAITRLHGVASPQQGRHVSSLGAVCSRVGTACMLSVSKRMRYIVCLLALVLLVVSACGSPPSSDSLPAASNPQSVSGTYIVNQNTERPACSVSPASGTVDIHSEPGGSTIVGRLPSNQWVLVSQRNDDGWYQVRYAGTPVDGGWIAPRAVRLQQPCACGPHCMVFEATSFQATLLLATITDCQVAFADGEFIRVMFLPDETASIFAVSTAGDDAAGLALARTEGWIGFDPGVNQPDRDGMDMLRWVQDNGDVTIHGEDCANLPVYTTRRVE